MNTRTRSGERSLASRRDMDNRIFDPTPPCPEDGLSDRSPSAFLPYQQRWCADESEVKICVKSRRIGLSWCEAGDAALLAARRNGMDVWYFGYNLDMTQQFIRDAAEWSRYYDLAAGGIEEGLEVVKNGKEAKKYSIEFASGHRIAALPSTPRSIRSKQGRVIIDEAAFHDDLGEMIAAVMAMLIWGGRVHIISTHYGVDNPFNETVLETRAGRKDYSMHHISFQDAIADGLYSRVCLRQGVPETPDGRETWREKIYDFYGTDADQELDCIPARSGGAYLPTAIIEMRTSRETRVARWAEEEEFTYRPEHIRDARAREFCEEEIRPLIEAVPKDARSYFGMDFAYERHLSAIAPIHMTDTLTRLVSFLAEMRKIPFEQQKQVLFFLIDRLPGFRGGAMDAGGNGQYLAQTTAQRYGESRIRQVKFSNGWYLTHMEPFKSALVEGNFTDIPNDPDVLADPRAIQVIDGVPKPPKTEKKEQKGEKTAKGQDNKRHGDTAVALILSHYASREITKGDAPIVCSRRPRIARALSNGYR